MTELETRQLVIALADRWAREYGIRPDEILGHGRSANVSEARQRVYYEAHKSGASFAAIGRAMQKDHTSVAYGVQRTELRLAE